MNNDDLSRLEKLLAAELNRAAIPASIESAVMHRFDRARARRRLSGGAFAVLIAASILVTVTYRGGRQPHPTPTPEVHSLDARVQAAPAMDTRLQPRPLPNQAPTPEPEPAATFVAIPYAPPLDAQDRPTVVRMSLPLPALAAAGLSIIDAEPDTLAEADVLVGQDGQPRAIRLISLSTR